MNCPSIENAENEGMAIQKSRARLHLKDAVWDKTAIDMREGESFDDWLFRVDVLSYWMVINLWTELAMKELDKNWDNVTEAICVAPYTAKRHTSGTRTQ